MTEAKAKKTKRATATKEAEKGSPLNGVVPPKSRRFGQPNGNPRHNGAWKKEDTPRYKLEQMMKMTEEELRQVTVDPTAPLFEKKVARCLKDGDWKTLESMINQVYGQPKQKIETTVEMPKPLVDLTKRKKNGE